MRHYSNDVLSVTSESVASSGDASRTRVGATNSTRALYLFTHSLLFFLYHSTKQRHCTRPAPEQPGRLYGSDIQHETNFILFKYKQ